MSNIIRRNLVMAYVLGMPLAIAVGGLLAVLVKRMGI
jgi:hypothetical protein